MKESHEKNSIFMVTKDEILSCAGEMGISKEQVTDAVIELIKRRLALEFQHWPEIVKGLLRQVTACPLGLVCYPSCFWWQNGRCTFQRQDLPGAEDNKREDNAKEEL